MKKLLFGLLFLISTISFSQVYPNYNGTLINDFANIIPDDQETYLLSKVKSYETQTSIQIVVVTVNSLNEEEISSYANNLFRKWGIGQAGLSNGLLILIAPTERKWRIEVGYGLEGWITDMDSKLIADSYFKSNFKKGDYYTGINDALDKFIDKIGSEGWEQRQQALALKKKKSEEDLQSFQNWFLIILLIAIVAFFIVFLLYKANKARQAEIDRIAEFTKQRIAKEKAIQEMKRKANAEILSLEADHKVVIIKVEKLVKEKFYKSDSVMEALTGTIKSDIDMIRSMPEDQYDGVFQLVKQTRSEIDTLTKLLFSNYEYKINIEKQSLQLEKNIQSVRDKISKAKYAIDKLKASYHSSDLANVNLDFAEFTEHLLTLTYLSSGKSVSFLINNDFPSAISNYKSTTESLEKANVTVDSVFKAEQELLSASAFVKSTLKDYPTLFEKVIKIVFNEDVSISTKRDLNSLKKKFEEVSNMKTNESVLLTYNLLSELIKSLNLIKTKASNEISDAERERKKKIDDENRRRRQREEDEEEEQRRQNDLITTSVIMSSNYDSTSSSSISDMSSDMGGGSSGGGGSDGNW